MSDAWLIVGLGNPGPEYEKTRHNIGQMVVDELAREVGGGFKKHGRARAQVLEGRLGIGGPKVVLAKPLTYMNTSGGPVSALAQFYDINPDRIIAVHGYQGLLPCSHRHRSSSRTHGHRRLRAQAFQQHRSEGPALPHLKRSGCNHDAREGRPAGNPAALPRRRFLAV